MATTNQELAKKKLIADGLMDLVYSARFGGSKVSIGLMAHGSELGVEEFIQGAKDAMDQNPTLQVVAFGPKPQCDSSCLGKIEWVETEATEESVNAALAKALGDKSIQGAVALHYPFPIGVTTIGKISTPARGKPLFMASCTGMSSPHRASAMLLNAIYGICVAKANGIANPTVGVLNLDAAPTVERALKELRENGYDFTFGSSTRSDSALLRGNDVLTGAVDVCVTDSLTGNVLVKTFGAYSTGGKYESQGWGYGPSVGMQWNEVISIISRASGAPVIANALQYTAKSAQNDLAKIVKEELAKARKAGLDDILNSLIPKAVSTEESVAMPPAEPTDAEIHGIDVLDIENAAKELWKKNIYAETAMGCTGPVIKLAGKNTEKAKEILKELKFI